MLRIEKIFEDAGIQDELDAYNPLVPDGRNWKATLQVEYEDVGVLRAHRLDCSSGILAARHHLEVRLALEQVLEPLQDDRVIVDEDYANTHPVNGLR